jgi:hypothetical protein
LTNWKSLLELSEEKLMKKLLMLLMLMALATPAFAHDDDDEVGPQGPQGIQGPIGPKGDKGNPGNNGANGTNGTNGVNGKDGATGAQGPKGNDGDSGLDATRENVGVTVRWYDWKHFSLTSGYKFDVNHHGHEIDMAVLNIKLGKSYEERRIERLERMLKVH